MLRAQLLVLNKLIVNWCCLSKKISSEQLSQCWICPPHTLLPFLYPPFNSFNFRFLKKFLLRYFSTLKCTQPKYGWFMQKKMIHAKYFFCNAKIATVKALSNFEAPLIAWRSKIHCIRTMASWDAYERPWGLESETFVCFKISRS